MDGLSGSGSVVIESDLINDELWRSSGDRYGKSEVKNDNEKKMDN